MTDTELYDVLVVGGGVSGLTASVFTARAGLTTVVVNDGESILRRNAHLENFPGFPAGVNSNLFTEMLEAQSTRNGADHLTGRVTAVRPAEADADDEVDGDDDARFVAELDETEDEETADDETTELRARYVVAASWSDVGYLDELDVDVRDAGSKRYVDEDGLGRTNVDGLYAAGRLSERYHQAIVSAGHGAEVAITLIHDSEIPYYHDWVAPAGYFSDRGREVPPGCEEISESERRVREQESMAAMQEYFAEPHPDRQRTHPSLVGDELGRLPDDE
ncbi:FAD-binding protein [Halogranum rubrum]|uniref:Thioredoxin reductase n=1 Tax=Halogranum salarium B-1 TaxID=1210908 RepID=J3JGS1_9EURY|nr:FAD-binding protein [Halogranum salarium]EJN60379.1 thioredoxin reductase [Halogranum salarium B-1]